MDRRDPEVSLVSSLVPTFNKIPKSTLEGKAEDSVTTVIPLANLVVYNSEVPTALVLGWDPAIGLLGSAWVARKFGSALSSL